MSNKDHGSAMATLSPTLSPTHTSSIDYSIDGLIDDYSRKRTTFSTLMRPEICDDEGQLWVNPGEVKSAPTSPASANRGRKNPKTGFERFSMGRHKPDSYLQSAGSEMSDISSRQDSEDYSREEHSERIPPENTNTYARGRNLSRSESAVAAKSRKKRRAKALKAHEKHNARSTASNKSSKKVLSQSKREDEKQTLDETDAYPWLANPENSDNPNTTNVNTPDTVNPVDTDSTMHRSRFNTAASFISEVSELTNNSEMKSSKQGGERGRKLKKPHEEHIDTIVREVRSKILLPPKYSDYDEGEVERLIREAISKSPPPHRHSDDSGSGSNSDEKSMSSDSKFTYSPVSSVDSETERGAPKEGTTANVSLPEQSVSEGPTKSMGDKVMPICPANDQVVRSRDGSDADEILLQRATTEETVPFDESPKKSRKRSSSIRRSRSGKKSDQITSETFVAQRSKRDSRQRDEPTCDSSDDSFDEDSMLDSSRLSVRSDSYREESYREEYEEGLVATIYRETILSMQPSVVSQRASKKKQAGHTGFCFFCEGDSDMYLPVDEADDDEWVEEEARDAFFDEDSGDEDSRESCPTEAAGENVIIDELPIDAMFDDAESEGEESDNDELPETPSVRNGRVETPHHIVHRSCIDSLKDTSDQLDESNGHDSSVFWQSQSEDEGAGSETDSDFGSSSEEEDDDDDMTAGSLLAAARTVPTHRPNVNRHYLQKLKDKTNSKKSAKEIVEEAEEKLRNLDGKDSLKVFSLDENEVLDVIESIKFRAGRQPIISVGAFTDLAGTFRPRNHAIKPSEFDKNLDNVEQVLEQQFNKEDGDVSELTKVVGTGAIHPQPISALGPSLNHFAELPVLEMPKQVVPPEKFSLRKRWNAMQDYVNDEMCCKPKKGYVDCGTPVDSCNMDLHRVAGKSALLSGSFRSKTQKALLMLQDMTSRPEIMEQTKADETLADLNMAVFEKDSPAQSDSERNKRSLPDEVVHSEDFDDDTSVIVESGGDQKMHVYLMGAQGHSGIEAVSFEGRERSSRDSEEEAIFGNLDDMQTAEPGNEWAEVPVPELKEELLQTPSMIEYLNQPAMDTANQVGLEWNEIPLDNFGGEPEQPPPPVEKKVATTPTFNPHAELWPLVLTPKHKLLKTEDNAQPSLFPFADSPTKRETRSASVPQQGPLSPKTPKTAPQSPPSSQSTPVHPAATFTSVMGGVTQFGNEFIVALANETGGVHQKKR